MVKPSQRREMAQAGAHEYDADASIKVVCTVFFISESCYRYQPKLHDEDAEIADWLLGIWPVLLLFT